MHSLTWTRISSIRPTVISTADRPGRGLTRICDRPTSFIRRRYIIDPPRAGLGRSCVGELFNSIDLIPPTEPRNQFALPHVALLSSAPDLIAMSPTMHILRTAVNFNLHNLLLMHEVTEITWITCTFCLYNALCFWLFAPQIRLIAYNIIFTATEKDIK